LCLPGSISKSPYNGDQEQNVQLVHIGLPKDHQKYHGKVEHTWYDKASDSANILGQKPEQIASLKRIINRKFYSMLKEMK
jgi:hypothetical protein